MKERHRGQNCSAGERYDWGLISGFADVRGQVPFTLLHFLFPSTTEGCRLPLSFGAPLLETFLTPTGPSVPPQPLWLFVFGSLWPVPLLAFAFIPGHLLKNNPRAALSFIIFHSLCSQHSAPHNLCGHLATIEPVWKEKQRCFEQLYYIVNMRVVIV